jgi:hypothetical protein
MKRWKLPAELPLCVGVLLLFMAVPGSAALPAAAGDQAEWFGDVYAAGLDYQYGDGLSQESIAMSRAELVTGFRELLTQPLDSQQFCDVTEWVCGATSMGQPDVPPPDLRLHQRAQTILYTVGLYLARPAESDQEEGERWDGILSQVGVLLDVLRQRLVQEFSDFPDAEQMAAGAVYSGAGSVPTLVRSPICPLLRRTFTDEEMASLTQYATELAPDARADWDAYQAHLAELEPDFEDPLALHRARSAMLGAASQFENRMRVTQYTAPQFLSAEEQEALRAAYRAMSGAEQAARQAQEEGQP